MDNYKKPCSTSLMGPASSTAIRKYNGGCVTAVTVIWSSPVSRVTVYCDLCFVFIMICFLLLLFFKRVRLNEFR